MPFHIRFSTGVAMPPDDSPSSYSSSSRSSSTASLYSAPTSSSSPSSFPALPSRGWRIEWFKGLREDIANRRPLYKSDWTDGMKVKTIPTILFLYFACLAPAVAFGGISYGLTQGAMGVIEFLLSCGVSGMLYAIFSGQPMTFIGPTGLTLCFMAALFNFCNSFGLAFMPMYTWVGIWTSLMLVTLSSANACLLTKHCTRFTDEVFNALLALNFTYEALKNIVVRFFSTGTDKTQPFLALNMALATFALSQRLVSYRSSILFTRRIRGFLSDFGPALTIIIMTLLGSLPMVRGLGIEYLKAPKRFQFGNGRRLFVPLWDLPVWARGLALVPAAALTVLFFLDHNISVRVVNSPDNKMKKSPAYHLDLFVLGSIVFLCSIVGLPWMCAATIQSLNHVRSVTEYEPVGVGEGGKGGGTAAVVVSGSGGGKGDVKQEEEETATVMETRLTGLGIHALVLSSIGLLPLLRRIPIPVISGIFLYLGRTVMTGNTFLQRVKGAFFDKSMLPEDSPFKRLGRTTVNKFTAIQVGCLAVLWTLKSNPATGMFFPSVIGMLILTRILVIPRLFSKEEISVLDVD